MRELRSVPAQSQHSITHQIWLDGRVRAMLGLVIVTLLGLWNMDGPPMWWDEGWTLSVARNFVERGMYVRVRDGMPFASGLEAAWPVVALVAGSFKLLGVGLWQGRLVGVLCVPLALAALFRLTDAMHGRRIAWGALVCALLLAAHPQVNVFIQGRQVLAEVPMLLLLCAGMLAFGAALRRSALWLLPAIVLLALAVIAKAQTTPFLVAGLGLAIVVAGAMRRWRSALLAAGALVSVPLARQLSAAWFEMLRDRLVVGQGVSGLMEVTAVVPSLFNRGYALSIMLMFGVPTALGLAYGAWLLVRDLHAGHADADVLVLRALVLGVAGSWMAWFVALSVGVPRYMFPPVFVGAAFTARLLHDLTGGFDAGATLRRLTAPLRQRGMWRACGAAWLAVLLLTATLPLSALSFYRYYIAYDDRSAFAVATFFNTETPPGTRIETYESELHFLLERPFHYPPDQAHVELNRRSLLGQDTPLDYDPLESNPDYLVVGVFARGNDLYAPSFKAGHWRLLRTIGDYQVYERAR